MKYRFNVATPVRIGYSYGERCVLSEELEFGKDENSDSITSFFENSKYRLPKGNLGSIYLSKDGKYFNNDRNTSFKRENNLFDIFYYDEMIPEFWNSLVVNRVMEMINNGRNYGLTSGDRLIINQTAIDCFWKVVNFAATDPSGKNIYADDAVSSGRNDFLAGQLEKYGFDVSGGYFESLDIRGR